MKRLMTLFLAIVPGLALGADQPLTRIAFGSCADQEKPLPIFDKIVDLKPQLYLALGDNVYVDIVREKGLDEMANMKAKYDKLAALPGWQKLSKACPMLATWDDHDYGKNDAGVEYPKKIEAQQLFLDFFNFAKDDPIRKQQGVYQAKIFGPEGKRVQVIMLDMRYFRTKLKRAERPLPGTRVPPYVPVTDADATFLGAEQWKWLEEQLKKPAEVRLLVSSIQVLSEEHPDEKWLNIPAEREKLYKLLRDTKANGVVILSGDRHRAELSLDSKAIGYPLYDITASGLNQGNKAWRGPEVNKHRVSSMNHGDHFGFITIAWDPEPKLTLQIRDEEGEPTIKETVPLAMLKPGALEVALPHTPSPGTISPREALKKINEKVTIEMKVQSVGTSSKENRLFVNSEKNFRDQLNFTIVVNTTALKGKLDGFNAGSFKDKIIKVTGTVTEFRGLPQLVIEDEKQIEFIEPK